MVQLNIYDYIARAIILAILAILVAAAAKTMRVLAFPALLYAIIGWVEEDDYVIN